LRFRRDLALIEKPTALGVAKLPQELEVLITNLVQAHI
jgi:hypothetical protein